MWRDQTKMLDAGFAAGIITLLLGSFLLLFRPALQRVSSLRQQTRVLTQQLELSSQVRTGLGHIQAEVAAVEQQLAAFHEQLPLEEQLDTYLRQIDQIAKQTGFNVTLIKPGTIQHQELYSQLPITISAASPFPEFYRFLGELHDLPRLTKIDALSVVRQGETDVCDIALTLLIYVAKAPDETSRR
jgi:Tfp pilus assembly protein PilO